jgi:hypothetical protein
VTDTPLLLMTQNLYPHHHINVELSDGDNNGWMMPSDDDTEGRGASSIEQIAPNPIGSSMLE